MQMNHPDVALSGCPRAIEMTPFVWRRPVTLVRSNAGTQRAMDEAEAAQRTAQARLNSSKTRLERRKMFSPVEGSVEQIYFRVGEMVLAGRPVVALLPPGTWRNREQPKREEAFVGKSWRLSVRAGTNLVSRFRGRPGTAVPGLSGARAARLRSRPYPNKPLLKVKCLSLRHLLPLLLPMRKVLLLL